MLIFYHVIGEYVYIYIYENIVIYLFPDFCDFYETYDSLSLIWRMEVYEIDKIINNIYEEKVSCWIYEKKNSILNTKLASVAILFTKSDEFNEWNDKEGNISDC